MTLLVTNNFGGASNPTSGLTNTTGGKLIVLAVSRAGGVPTVSDSFGNTYTALTERTVSGGNPCRLHYCIAPTVGAGHTWTLAGTEVYAAAAVLVFDDNVTAFDAQSGAGVAASTSIQPGAITPTQTLELFVTGLTGQGAVNSTASQAINSGFTIGVRRSDVEFQSAAVAAAYKVQSSYGPENPTWTWNGSSGNHTAAMAAFRVAGGSAPPTPELTGAVVLGDAVASGSLSTNTSALAGNVALDDAVASGLFAQAGVSALAGSVVLDDVSASGSMGSSGSATIVSQQFKSSETKLLLGAASFAHAVLLRVSDRHPAASVPSPTTASDSRMTITSAGLTAGTDYVLVVWSTDGALAGAQKVTAA